MGALVMFFGALVIAHSTLMLATAGYETWQAAARSLALLWGGIAIVAAGYPIRKTRVLVASPRWFMFAFFWGVMSVFGLFTGITQQDAMKIAIFTVLQLVAVYLLWRAVSPRFYSAGP